MTERSIEASARRLRDIMAALRVGCPWDREQTHASLRRYLIEECHEVLEAIDAGDLQELRAELGDLLFQIWFHAEVASEQGSGFDLIDVFEGISDKLVRRHPHVFEQVETDKERLRGQWERLKMAEGGRRSRLDGVPPLLPALLQAERFQEKAASVGFDWKEVSGVLAKVSEEVAELNEALNAERVARERVEAEFGDLLFTLVNFARHQGIVAEDALRLASGRFRERFQFMEREAVGEGRALSDETEEGLGAAWERAKAAERQPPEGD